MMEVLVGYAPIPSKLLTMSWRKVGSTQYEYLEDTTMSKTVMTGKQVKELLKKAIGGIYFEKNYENAITDIIKEYTITENGLMVDFKNCLTLNIPIPDDKDFTNYAVEGKDGNEVEEALQEEWEGSIYFDYKFEIMGHILCFNTEDKGKTLTWEQFKEVTDSRNDIFQIRSVDTGSLYMDINNCTIEVRDREIEINSKGVNTIFDRSIIETIYNDSIGSEDITYRIEFNNGMSEIEIEPEYRVRKFQ